MSDANPDSNSSYKVLARKYRPRNFGELIGQETMVKILENSFEANRVAHAFMLTGVRGVGKTTTARIIAKALNCNAVDGQRSFAKAPCGNCDICLAIAKGNNVDVIEVDAASRTGVSDIREIIDSVQYRAASSKFKIYIIDEVHMLSISAFNALLKTLEEPPEHVKFIFATTEIKKVPVTILSRCQRFDLRRIESGEMIAFLRKVSAEEGFLTDDQCLAQIARASDGSMRDALSLLEQILIDSDGVADLGRVRSILGLSDRGRVIDLFYSLVQGDIAAALTTFNSLHAEGADPLGLIRELSEFTHWLTIVKVSPQLLNDTSVAPDERERGMSLSKALPIPVLTRLWQLFLKVIEEVSATPDPKIAAEMGLIRVAYTSKLPTPGDIIKSLVSDKDIETTAVETKDQYVSTKENISQSIEKGESPRNKKSKSEDFPASSFNTSNDAKKPLGNRKSPPNFRLLVDLIRSKREIDLLIEVEDNLRIVNYQIGRIEFEPTENASKSLASRLNDFLKKYTETRWVISVVSSGGGATIKEENAKLKKEQETACLSNPVVKAIFDSFPNSRIDSIHKWRKSDHLRTNSFDGIVESNKQYTERDK